MPLFVIVLIYSSASVFIAGAGLALSYYCSPKKECAVKSSPYECGMTIEHTPKNSINSGFYFYALLFLVFDIELLFLLPWALSLESIGVAGFVGGMVFIAHLVIVFIYELWKGVLRCP